MANSPAILIFGTCDTKLVEIMYLREQILVHGKYMFRALVVDIGCSPIEHKHITITQSEIARQAQDSSNTPLALSELKRGDYVDLMILAATKILQAIMDSESIQGLIGVGGSTGTSLSAAVMRKIAKIGLPKLIVSTMASGDTSTYVDNVDITLMYSVVDIAGLNFLSEAILSNAAGAICGMAQAHQIRIEQERQLAKEAKRKRIGVTMFGVTTPSCDAIRQILTDQHNYEVVVFHATGSGGRAFERLINEGALDGAIDLTTTEIADELVGGVLTAGPDRLVAGACSGMPYLVSVGACDMVNFGPKESISGTWIENGRNLYVHNPAVTLMRTTGEECVRIGEYISKTLKTHSKAKKLVKVVLPLGGVSNISEKGGPFEDQEADHALFEAIRSGLRGSGVDVLESPQAINDETFARRIVDILVSLMEIKGQSEIVRII